jgi:hypothetical protein
MDENPMNKKQAKQFQDMILRYSQETNEEVRDLVEADFAEWFGSGCPIRLYGGLWWLSRRRSNECAKASPGRWSVRFTGSVMMRLPVSRVVDHPSSWCLRIMFAFSS